jgi:hypothetical protein
LGIVTFLRFQHKRNVEFPIRVTLVPIVTLVKPPKEKNAASPRMVTGSLTPLTRIELGWSAHLENRCIP